MNINDIKYSYEQGLFAACVSSLMVSPIMTVIDSSIVRNQLIKTNQTFWQVCKDTE
jgi:predicted membrane-bound dolichyl-phosphate-mannose-protein mannosyltransferase